MHQWSNCGWLCLSVRLNGVCTMLVHVLYNNQFIHVLCCFILTVDYMSVEHYLIVWCRELSNPLFCIMWDIVSENMYRSSKWNDVGIDRYMYIMEDTVWSVGDLLYNTIFIMYSFITTHLSLFSTVIQFTPLHVSSVCGYSQVVDLLLSQPGIVVDSCDKVL